MILDQGSSWGKRGSRNSSIRCINLASSGVSNSSVSMVTFDILIPNALVVGRFLFPKPADDLINRPADRAPKVHAQRARHHEYDDAASDIDVDVRVGSWPPPSPSVPSPLRLLLRGVKRANNKIPGAGM